MKVVSATKKRVTLRITNKGYKHVHHYGGFILKKRVKNKWKIVRFKEGTMFAKTKTIWGKSSTTVKFTWKKFFGKNLSKGNYKIKYIKVKNLEL